MASADFIFIRQCLFTNEYMNAHMGQSLTKLIFTVCEQHRIHQNKRMCSRRIWARSMQMSLSSAHKTVQQHLFSILSHLHEDNNTEAHLTPIGCLYYRL